MAGPFSFPCFSWLISSEVVWINSLQSSIFYKLLPLQFSAEMGKIDMTSNYWPLISEEKWRYPSLNFRCALDFQIATNEGSWTCFCQWYSSQLSPEIYSRLLGLDLHVFCNLSKVNPFKKNMEAQQIDLVDVFSVAEGPLWVECLWRVECDSLKTPSQLLATAWRLVRTQVLWSAYGYGSKKRWFSFPLKE